MTMQPAEPGDRFDLTAACLILRRDGKNKGFVTAVKRLTEADSGRVDLENARERLAQAHALKWKRSTSEGDEYISDPANVRLAGSLMETAVLLYVKVATSNDDRGPLPLMRGASTELQSLHKKILRLRNAGVGHFSYGDDNAFGEWAADRIIAVFDNGNLSGYINPWLRTNYRSAIFNDLQKLLDHAIPAVRMLSEERQSDLSKLMMSLDAQAWDIIFRHRVGWTKPEERAVAMGVSKEPTEVMHFSTPAKW